MNRTFLAQEGTPAAIPNFIDLVAGCNWSGIGGQIFDLAGSPKNGVLVKISGTLEGRQVLKYVYTGSSQYFGPGGFDLKLVDHPVSSQTLTLQVLDAAGVRRSAAFPLTTYRHLPAEPAGGKPGGGLTERIDLPAAHIPDSG